MKITANSNKKFDPVYLTITLESQEEVDEFRTLFYLKSVRDTLDHTDSVAICVKLRPHAVRVYGHNMYMRLLNNIRR